MAWIPPAAAQIRFQDVALEAGFQDRLSHGRALVAADFNGDGRTDFFLGNPSDPALGNDDSFILWNDGPGAGGAVTFSKGPVLLQGKLAFTASAADYDNDGDPDLFVGIGGQEGIGLDYLFRNDGGAFVDVSAAAGIRGPLHESGDPVPVSTSSGTWADYDRDGDLDLFVASRLKESDSLRLPGDLGWRDSLFRNEGDGTFTDVTATSGIDGTKSSMSAAWSDLDNDGWEDLYIPHFERGPSDSGFQLYRNNQDGTFTELGIDEASLGYSPIANWASVAADFDNNGWIDVLTFARRQTGLTGSHALLMNHGGFQFTNEAESSGLAPAGIDPPRVMGCQVGDLDNNGFPDVIMANGGPLNGDRDVLLMNAFSEGFGLRFVNATDLLDVEAPLDPSCVSPAAAVAGGGSLVDDQNMLEGSPNDPNAVDTAELALAAAPDLCSPAYPYRGHAVILFDMDSDGDQDLAMLKGGTEIIAPELPSAEPNRLFRNLGGNDLNSLYLTLRGTVSNRDAVGARVQLDASRSGGTSRSVFRTRKGGSGFSASGPPELHFGLGSADRIDRILVFWPSGIETALSGAPVNGRITIQEPVLTSATFGAGVPAGWSAVSGSWAVADGQLTQDAPGRAVFVETRGSRVDFSVVGRLTYLEGAQTMALLARVSPDGRNFYAAMLGGSTAQIYKSVDGVLTPLGGIIPIEEMTTGRSYVVRLEVKRTSIEMAVDFQQSERVTDASIQTGSVGVSTNDTRARFDNLAAY